MPDKLDYKKPKCTYCNKLSLKLNKETTCLFCILLFGPEQEEYEYHNYKEQITGDES